MSLQVPVAKEDNRESNSHLATLSGNLYTRMNLPHEPRARAGIVFFMEKQSNLALHSEFLLHVIIN
uniref:Uncharacterized 7.4 kDa protein in ndhF-psbD intergenic region n=1 Tax=Mesostigma viride TaxID=41882 RepID=YCX6_MESVI|nr:hypothetical protein MeviCp087 [Mesostigma viride]Q9MUM6.1 RecName: Full=Uncharacterized 7.4 kDa protein in ndhF-psbD intergenic region [Mesostigma viride]AAF43893.1 unknown [Mesostigma viride]WKT08280.1 hypothetical protein [Mesostigma viride]